MRTIYEGEIWYCARDVAQELDYSTAKNNTITNLFRAIPDNWKRKFPVQTEKGKREMIFISEEGLALFLQRSDKSKAKPFQMQIARSQKNL